MNSSNDSDPSFYDPITASREFTEAFINGLLCLPDNEILQKVQVMDIEHIIEFSLISKRCKRLVQSLHIKAERISAAISTTLHLNVSLPGRNIKITFPQPDGDQKRKLEARDGIFIDRRCLKRIGFKYIDWLKHLQDIFHNSTIAGIEFHAGTCDYDLDEIKKVFGAPKELYARDTFCKAFNFRVFQMFQPVEKLNFNPFMFWFDSDFLWSILQQNYTALDIVSDNDPGEMALNDLLLVNSKSITIQNIHFSPQDVNKFIKLWIKGSSPRMEYLKIFHTDRFRYDSAMVMKGIQHSEVEQDEKMEVYKMNGTRATIIFKCGSVQMRVWFD